MRTSEIAQRFLNYFERNNHHIEPSASLVSPNPTTLFTIAGMVPFIPYLLAEQTPQFRRVASNQKCVRTLDIDEVGKTTRHGTFFQMLGNFSFGSYFKEEAIHYAWELLTLPQEQGGYGFNPDDLWVTTYTDDEESRSFWRSEGMHQDHMQILGMEDNFWTTGGPGPGGPCTEIYFDRGPEYGKDGGPAADDNRFIEIWNLVFENMEVDNVKSKTDLHIVGELQQKNIDTGAGLERLAYVLQGKQNIYETDEVWAVLDATQRLTGRSYGTNNEDDRRLRVVADHVRSALMIMSDGVRPSNVGRGYVLRRLLRRTIHSMRVLGIERPILPDLLPVSKDAMKASYPQIVDTFAQVEEAAYGEEDAFLRTLEKGITILDVAVKQAKQQKPAVLSGKDAFTLHDTYGFPVELTLEMAQEQGVDVNKQEFDALMHEQKQRARGDALRKRNNVDVAVYDELKKKLPVVPQFTGYSEDSSSANIVGIVNTRGELVPSLQKDASLSDDVADNNNSGNTDKIAIVLDRTPFYAERGGQIADTGYIIAEDGSKLEVLDVQRPIKDFIVHTCKLVKGTIFTGQKVTAVIDSKRRKAIMRSHSGTHILHKVLREVLGSEATQRGSVVAPDRLRFDFQWPHSLNEQTLHIIEERVNERLRDNLRVTAEYMPYAQAIESGALHLFGEKYTDTVRVVTIGDNNWSQELCGGTHVPSSGVIGMFTVVSESSIGSGVRRIEAYVGQLAFEYYAQQHATVNHISSVLNSQPDQLISRVEQLQEKIKEYEHMLQELYTQQLRSLQEEIIQKARQRVQGEVTCVTYNIGHFGSVDSLRSSALEIRAKLGNDRAYVIALAGVNEQNKPAIVVALNSFAVSKGIKAGNLVKKSSIVLGGGGGGKPDFAQGGGIYVDKIQDALSAVEQAVTTF